MDIAICIMYMVNFQCPWPHIISNNILKYIYKADAVCTWEVFTLMALLHFDNLVHHAVIYITSFVTSIVGAACSRWYRSNIYMYQTINEETKITRIPIIYNMTIHTSLIYKKSC